MKQASEAFANAFVRTSSIVSDCFCGRTCFENDPSAGDWNEGELERLREMEKKEPDKFIPMDHVGQAEIDGKTFIVGCPCNKLIDYENFIWSHRRQIMEYISAKVKDIVERALEEEGMAEEATADLDQEERAVETVRCPKCLKFVSQIAMRENGVCVKCWDTVQAEAEAERRRLLEEQEREEQKRADDHEDNLPF